MKYLDKYPNCIGCPVKKWCGTMISCIRLCKSYQENKTEMNYEERYKQAIEAAKRELNCCGSLDCDAARQIFRLFPELRESEDEKIRKALIEMVHDTTGDSLWVDYDVHKEDAIAWLEKQGEQKSVEWSEEDDDARDIAIRIIQNGGDDCAGILDSDKALNWLKSLKPNHWKPSKEQMQALFEAKLASINNREYFLGLLYEDLKKL